MSSPLARSPAPWPLSGLQGLCDSATARRVNTEPGALKKVIRHFTVFIRPMEMLFVAVRQRGLSVFVVMLAPGQGGGERRGMGEGGEGDRGGGTAGGDHPDLWKVM